jgi:uncharacterized protein YbbC (DUF1343 family)/CubicO group peptidase (beta-lactamase class C family)
VSKRTLSEAGERVRYHWIALFFLACVPIVPAFADSAPDGHDWSPVASTIEESIRAGHTPGAVILIGNQGKVVYRQAFGHRAVAPQELPMTADTIFDLASLTKVVATTTAVMQLIDKGKLRVDDPVAKYWPEFRRNGKARITVRHLLTHYSGLRDVPLKNGTVFKTIAGMKPVAAPGLYFLYSDINFITLGELVRRVSGLSLDAYCDRFIFKPLGMHDTGFRPAAALGGRIAPTQVNGNAGALLREVHDPISQMMGGVAGHAGLFSTADDLSIFAQALLDGGSANGARILSPLAVERMTTPQNPPNKKVLRGLGWDIDSPLSSCRGDLFPIGSYGHTGFTGTLIWIDPDSKTYVILLTNRVHLGGKGNVIALRSQVSTLVAAEIGRDSGRQEAEVLGDSGEPAKDEPETRSEAVGVATGLCVLDKNKYASLSGLKIGLITNHSGIDSAGRSALDLFCKAPGLKLVSVFTPEHGLSGQVDAKIPSNPKFRKGIPLYSLYGDTLRPTEKMVQGLNALVFDVQDVGVRFYTYITTMAYAMEAAAKKGIPFYVLDRPNPLTASAVQGPVLDDDLKSFTGYFPLPLRHGMTVGELAQLFNGEKKIGAKLQVIPMEGYRRTDWYDETGLMWVNPSPNLRTLTQTILYPGVGMLEAANLSVGRGTGTPFELLGAPWIKARELASYLNNRNIDGVRFMPLEFVPNNDRYKDQVCRGVQIALTDRQALDSGSLGLELAAALYKLYAKEFEIEKTVSMIGSRQALRAIKEGQDPKLILEELQPKLEEFMEVRSKYLLY